MFISFEELKDTSRIWIFQADRKLTGEEESAISSTLQEFTNSWAAHGKPLNSSFKIYNHLHVVVGVDLTVNEATGCSIDKLVHLMQMLGQENNLDFFNRTSVAYLKDDNVHIDSFNTIKGKIASGEFGDNTVVFNNLIDSKGELGNEWQIPASKSWLGKLLKKKAITT